MMRSRRDHFRWYDVERLESRTLLSASFKIVDLGLLPGGNTSAAYGINQAGLVVGNANTADGNTVAFKFAGAALSEIGSPSADTTVHAFAVNSQGDVTGEMLVGKYEHAYFYSDGVMHDLGTLGGDSSFAYAINDADTIVGGSYIAGNKLVQAFVWTPSTGIKDLGTLGGGFSLAYAITAAGQIAGYSTNSKGRNDAFLYSDGKMYDLGTMQGAGRSIAYGINAAGQIAGEIDIGGNAQAILYAGGKYTDLGTLGGASSTAYGINRSGDIVGFSAIKGSSTTHAFEYHDGKMYDLNQEIAPATGWTLLAATAVNDAGQIVGLGMIHGQIHGFLLDPA